MVGATFGFNCLSFRTLRSCTYELNPSLLRLDFAVHTHERTIRGYRDRFTRTVVDKDVRAQATIDEPAVAEHLRTKGWRVYVTNAPREE